MTDDVRKARERFDRTTASLVGCCIEGVTYWDVNSFGEPRTWNHGDWHHAVMGAELVTDAGPWTVIWTSTFHPYGVELFPEGIDRHLVLGPDGPEGWETGDHPFWRSRAGTPVTAVGTFWESIDYCGKIVEVPIALRVDVGPGPVWFVAAMPAHPDVTTVHVMADEIMVVFSAHRMRALGFPAGDFLR